jgi:hypothetical protein
VSALFSRLLLICLWRAGPQDLPYSSRLLVQLLALLAVLQLIAMQTTGAQIDMFARLALYLAFLLLPIAGLLRITGHPERFVQTAIAFAGTSVLVLLPMLGLLALMPSALQVQAEGFQPSGVQMLSVLLYFALAAWKVAIDAHVWRHALQCSPLAAAALAIALFMAEITANRHLFAGP